MELVSILRVLARHRLLVALGCALALVAGAVASGRLALAGFEREARLTWIAALDVQVDTPSPLAADVESSTAAIQTQTALLADHLAVDEVEAGMAAAAGVPPAEVTVLSPVIGYPSRASTLAQQGAEVAREAETPYAVTPSWNSLSPLISVLAIGPDASRTMRLGSATVDALKRLVLAHTPHPKLALTVRQLGATRLHPVVTGGASVPLGGAAAVLFFVAWCGTVVVVSGLRRTWRRTLPRPPAPAG